jgi:hypothetical protein
MAEDPPFGIDPDSRELWWLSESHPRDLLEFVESHIEGRKWRLFMCACGRRCYDAMPGELCRRAVDLSEAYADGQASPDAMIVFADAVYTEIDEDSQLPEVFHAGRVAVGVASLGGSHLFEVTIQLIEDAALAGQREETEYRVQSEMLRDIFGNPFRPVTFSPEWRTDTAASLARTMYESRDFSAMPILADALQDAGCDNNDILNHCRDTTATHMRGCWVVDLVLGKT